jgi:hypothetical protein
MKVVKEKRHDERWQYMAPISFSYFNKESFFDAQTLNYGSGGLCFKSNFFLKPGTIIFIRLKNFNPNGFYNGDSEGLRSVTLAEVKWCGEIHDIDIPVYSVGVGYFPPVY